MAIPFVLHPAAKGGEFLLAAAVAAELLDA
jgi:hypothetical protein